MIGRRAIDPGCGTWSWQVVGYSLVLLPGVSVYLDVSLRRFELVYPAAGNENSVIGLTLPELERCSASQGWVDVCKDWREEIA